MSHRRDEENRRKRNDEMIDRVMIGAPVEYTSLIADSDT